jgi:hypothetical protein
VISGNTYVRVSARLGWHRLLHFLSGAEVHPVFFSQQGEKVRSVFSSLLVVVPVFDGYA